MICRQRPPEGDRTGEDDKAVAQGEGPACAKAPNAE